MRGSMRISLVVLCGAALNWFWAPTATRAQSGDHTAADACVVIGVCSPDGLAAKAVQAASDLAHTASQPTPAQQPAAPKQPTPALDPKADAALESLRQEQSAAVRGYMAAKSAKTDVQRRAEANACIAAHEPASDYDKVRCESEFMLPEEAAAAFRDRVAAQDDAEAVQQAARFKADDDALIARLDAACWAEKVGTQECAIALNAPVEFVRRVADYGDSPSAQRAFRRNPNLRYQPRSPAHADELRSRLATAQADQNSRAQLAANLPSRSSSLGESLVSESVDAAQRRENEQRRMEDAQRKAEAARRQAEAAEAQRRAAREAAAEAEAGAGRSTPSYAAKSDPSPVAQSAPRLGSSGGGALYSSSCIRDLEKVERQVRQNDVHSTFATYDTALVRLNDKGAEVMARCAGYDPAAANKADQARRYAQKIRSYCAGPHQAWECTEYGAPMGRPPGQNEHFIQFVMGEYDKALIDPNYSSDLGSAGGGSMLASRGETSPAGGCPGGERAAAEAFDADLQRLRAQHPERNLGTMATYQHTYALLSDALGLLGQRKLCLGSRYDPLVQQLSRVRDTAKRGCEQVSSTNACSPTYP